MELHRVVIVGGGFAGLRTAFELEKRRVRLKDCSVTLVDRRAEHTYTPLLYEVSSGELESSGRACSKELRSGACVPFGGFTRLLGKGRVRFVRDEVVGIDRESNEVLLRSGGRIPFDDLVLAPGSEVSTHGIPGAAEHAYPMKTLRDAFRIRERMHGFVEAYKRGDEKRISIVVAGGGATGVEFAAETAHFFQRLVREGIVRASDASLSLVEADPDILPTFSAGLRGRARARLAALGVEVSADTRLKEVRPGAVVTVAKDGVETTTEADVTVWTAGVKPLVGPKEWGLPVDERGYVRTDRSFAVEGVKNMYALGDAVVVLHPKRKARVPALAQVAVREAGIVAENIARGLERKAPTLWNPPERWVTMVPMGGTYAIAEFGRLCVYGRLGFAFRKCADLQYFLSILPPREAWNLWRRGAGVYARND
jgi:NADH dehydrogenase